MRLVGSTLSHLRNGCNRTCHAPCTIIKHLSGSEDADDTDTDVDVDVDAEEGDEDADAIEDTQKDAAEER